MRFLLLAFLAIGAVACASYASRAVSLAPNTKADTKVGTRPGRVGDGTPLTPSGKNQLAAFSAGCFWGVEERFRQVPGVVATAVGYTGGSVQHPTYPQVCTHTTGHAETVLVEFDPSKVGYSELLNQFWGFHDPTTVDRQGPDVGANYRSAIWTFGPEQLRDAQVSLEKEQKKLGGTVVTRIAPIGPFWIAEDYHQQYDEKNGVEACPVPVHG